jgi:Xaa-Pro aminopeptidase
MLAEFHMGQVADYDVRVLADDADPEALAADVLKGLGVQSNAHVALEDRAWAETVLHLQDLLGSPVFSLASALLMPLRRVKDEHEIALLREAGQITEAAYAATLTQLEHGMTTLDLVSEVNYQLAKHGASAESFVTSFYNMGRDYPFDFSNRKETLVLPLTPPVSISFDFGAVHEGYCYDFGRSVFFGESGQEYRECYRLVMEAQAVGIAALSSGRTCEQVDAAARGIIASGGYGQAFRHRLGHGIGMDVHEPPFLTAGDTTVLEPGMVFTVEPSIFLPRHLGARVEDVVVVREDGGEALTSGYRSLHVVD